MVGSQLKSIYSKSKETLHNFEAENEFLFGNEDSCIAIENNIKYAIDWVKGQKTGFFIDQRENRAGTRARA